MIIHSLIINYSKEVRPAVFTLGRTWNVHQKRTLDTIIRHLTRLTANDKRGRILCVGSVKVGFSDKTIDATADEQDRIFVCKMGHDGKMWTRTYPLYEDVVKTLKRNARTIPKKA